MSSRFGSSVRKIPYSQQPIYSMLGDLTSIEKVRDKVPKDEIKDLASNAGSISIHSPMGDVQPNIIERDGPKCIEFETRKSPIPVNPWIQILFVTDRSSKMKLTMKAEVDPFIKAMVKKPLQEDIGEVTDALRVIRYK